MLLFFLRNSFYHRQTICLGFQALCFGMIPNSNPCAAKKKLFPSDQIFMQLRASLLTTSGSLGASHFASKGDDLLGEWVLLDYIYIYVYIHSRWLWKTMKIPCFTYSISLFVIRHQEQGMRVFLYSNKPISDWHTPFGWENYDLKALNRAPPCRKIPPKWMDDHSPILRHL